MDDGHAERISKFLKAVGSTIFQAYIQKTFPPEWVALDYYTPSNAIEWIDIKDFMAFAAQHSIQKSSSSTSGLSGKLNSPISSHSSSATTYQSFSETSNDQSCLPSITIKTESTIPDLGGGCKIVDKEGKAPNPERPSSAKSSHTDRQQILSAKVLDVIEISDDSDDQKSRAKISSSNARQKPLLSSFNKHKRKAVASDSDIEIIGDPSIKKEAPSGKGSTISKSKNKKRLKIQRPRSGNNSSDSEDREFTSSSIVVTRQLRVKEVKVLKTIPSTWTVFNGAWLLDLSDDTQDWVDKDTGELYSMAAIIKSQDYDSWGGRGSGGHINPAKCPTVHLLDDQKCQVSERQCKGVYHCSELDMSLLDGCERYEPDSDEMRDLFEAEREVNLEETSTTHARAASFYQDALKEHCRARLPHEDYPEGQVCRGEAVYRRYREQNYDGKEGFIGCSNWIKDKGNDHRFVPIPRAVDEDLVVELFERNGTYSKDISTKKCARVLHPRHGGRGKGECPYTHMCDGKVVQGKLIYRPCPTKMKIFSPLDRKDHRAIVVLQSAHNHPCPPPTKVLRDGQDKYKKAVEVNGISRSTVLKCDMAATTKDIFGGKEPGAIDPALNIPRNKRKIISGLKKEHNPHGSELPGVYMQKRKDEEKLPKNKRYIQEISTKDEVDMIITMLPGLAEHIHAVNATLHDNTYKRVYGDWKEWEVVIWDRKLNTRITVAGIYCTHETREAFEQIWTGFWDTVKKVTGKPVKFKFIDGVGQAAIIVDGCKPQANGCGDALLKQIASRGNTVSFKETDPMIIIQYILRTCDIHLERKLDDLAKTLPKEMMGRVRRFPFLETVGKVQEFVKWCQESEFPCLRDWMNDKKASPWFIPSVNRFMSKIPTEDWFLTPGHTNLNESAHPYTNMHTGINLPILGAIEEAYKLDLSTEEKLKSAEENCVLLNNHNTQMERDRSNRKRQESRARKHSEKTETAEELQEIEKMMKNLTQANKDVAKQKKELQERKKTLQESAGLKRSPPKQGARGKARLPDLEDDEGKENVSASSSSRVTKPEGSVILFSTSKQPDLFEDPLNIYDMDSPNPLSLPINFDAALVPAFMPQTLQTSWRIPFSGPVEQNGPNIHSASQVRSDGLDSSEYNFFGSYKPSMPNAEDQARMEGLVADSESIFDRFLSLYPQDL